MDVREHEPGDRVPADGAAGGLPGPAGPHQPRVAAQPVTQSARRQLLRPGTAGLLPESLQ